VLRNYGNGNSEKVVLTRIQVQVNLPFDRLKDYIVELKELGLLENEGSLQLTEKGRQYLKEYKRILLFLKSMGLNYQSYRE